MEDAIVQSDVKHWLFMVVNDAGRAKVLVEYRGKTKSFSPEEVSPMVLQKMKEITEAYLGKTVSKAMGTVLAYLNDSRGRQLKILELLLASVDFKSSVSQLLLPLLMV